MPADGHEGLTLVKKRAPGGRADGLVEIGVPQHDQRGVPTQLQVGPLEIAAGQLADHPAGTRRTMLSSGASPASSSPCGRDGNAAAS